MKMKKNLILLSGICALLLIASCKNFLTEDNKTNINADNYYRTETGYTDLMNALYGELRSIYGYNYDVWMYCGGTDLYWEGTTGKDQEDLNSYESLSPANGLVTQYYDSTYHAIQVANTAIYYNSKTVSSTTTNLKSDLGESQFMRALFYFNLVRFFGGVALTTKMIQKPVLSFERAPADSVYTFIINQMKQALQEVPASNTPGKVNKRIVNFYLAKVNLTYAWWLTNPYNLPNTQRKDPNGHNSQYYFQQAVNYADAAINNQPLNDISFANEWDPNNGNNPNVIFAVQYSVGSLIDPKSDGNDQNYFFSPYLGGEGATQNYPYRSHSLLADPFLFSLYTQYDTRIQASFMLTFYEHYYDFYSNTSSDTVKYYYVPTWDQSNVTSWQNADPAQRKNAIIVPEADWAPSYSFQPYNGAPIPPPVRKFDDPSAQFAQHGSTRNIILARLADAYLVKAEAEFKLGNNTAAAQAINVVRERAAVTGHQADMDITPGQVTINLILDERARELLGEYHRWFDLKRTGQLVTRDEKYNRNVQLWISQGTFIGGVQGFGSKAGDKLLRPIPQTAIDLNHATVQQNQGY